MQYSLLYSSSIVQHFSFYRMKLFQLENFFSQEKNKMVAISKPSRSHLLNLFFEPYLINIRCSLGLKYVIQLEVP